MQKVGFLPQVKASSKSCCCVFKIRTRRFSSAYTVDYSKTVPSGERWCETYKAVYEVDKTYRIVKRIPKTRLNLRHFLEGIRSITTVCDLAGKRVGTSECAEVLRVVHRGELCVFDV